jgi:hypothetical protein
MTPMAVQIVYIQSTKENSTCCDSTPSE